MAAMQEGLETKRLHARSAVDAETLAYGFWGLVHGLASLQLTALRGFDADFSTADHETIATFIRGLK